MNPENSTPRLVLYMTGGCHLCEQAQRIVLEVCGLPAAEVDIAADKRLLDLYGVRIPVLRRIDGEAEMGWPFDAQTVRHFLATSWPSKNNEGS